MTKKIVILLHGVGSSGDDLLPLAQSWAEVLPDTVFVSPNAPMRFDQGFGHQWFSISGVTVDNRSQRVEAARPNFDAVIRGILEQNAIDPVKDKVILVGFSQGSIMALDALVNDRFPLAAVVAFSGRLASVEPFTPSHTTKVLLIHGKFDQVIPWTESQSAEQRLNAVGVDVQLSLEEGTPHTISPAGARIAARFIAAI
ncbi:phospholipase [Rouxiella sp. S1S-2]|uniref:alpha/beta hydrolase n=1 Tax=Rouxiella sp. S1S-2 TaxID=2653856 RepID=UPI0012646C3E|nr:dienelactone hydrolase family protein [Rouxiella sp. S1S-2]KAB7896503.1 phospholipase [Rouxiella sp. S1S-2]